MEDAEKQNSREFELVNVDLDEDILAWLKAQGPEYETFMNDILREATLKELKK